MSSTVSITIWRMSGASIGGSGSDMSSKQIVSFMPGRNSAGNGSRSPERVQQRMADGPVGVLDRLHRLGRVDHPAPLGQRLEGEALAVPEQGRWGRLVHLEDEAGSAAHRAFLSVRRRRSSPPRGGRRRRRGPRRPRTGSGVGGRHQAPGPLGGHDLEGQGEGRRRGPPCPRRARCRRRRPRPGGPRGATAAPGPPSPCPACRPGDTVPRGRTMASDCAIDSALPTQSITTSAPARQRRSDSRRAPVGQRARVPPHRPGQLVRRQHLGAAELARQPLLVRVAGAHEDRGRGGAAPHRGRGGSTPR